MENSSSNLEVSKQFECSKEALYKAWTEPDQLKQWWRPMGKQLVDVENNLEQNGYIKYLFEENSLAIDGQYEKVVDNSELVYSWNWKLAAAPVEDASYKLHVKFEGNEKSSSITIKQEGFKNEESVHPHKQGWEQGLQQLHEFVKNSENTVYSNATRQQQKPPITGYNETPEQEKVGGA